MKATIHILVLILMLLSGMKLIAQVNDGQKVIPITVMDIVKVFKVPTSSTESDDDLSKNAIKLLGNPCDVDFIDDGANYTVLRIAGANEGLIRQIDKCRSPEQTTALLERLRTKGDEQAYLGQKVLFGDLIRFLYPRRDFAGRKKTIVACKEYLKRYGEDSRYGDPGTDELLVWIKAMLPKMEQIITPMHSIV